MIKREDVAGVAVVQLAHGPVNALDLDLVNAITATFRELDAGDEQAVVLTGAGRAFSAGVDLWRVVEGGPEYAQAYVPALVDAFEAVFTCAKPVVAAVNGHAVAGGAILTSGCDYRLMADGPGRIGVSELLVGVAFPTSALEILSFALGPVLARRAVLEADTYEPATALARGFIDEVVPAERLLDSAVAAARRLADLTPPATYAMTKRQLRAEAMERIHRLRPRFDAEAVELWMERARDGRIRDYMERVTSRRAGKSSPDGSSSGGSPVGGSPVGGSAADRSPTTG
ncbi:MAG TPA: enoyl-CoA hydratase/isomerase family protein [Micromonosporaceae bacterium]|nr:enoyl-CoA hydratase/isomerase family protein [Micromonosporaceae bacterium]